MPVYVLFKQKYLHYIWRIAGHLSFLLIFSPLANFVLHLDGIVEKAIAGETEIDIFFGFFFSDKLEKLKTSCHVLFFASSFFLSKLLMFDQTKNICLENNLLV
jgi:hypothetical protein